MHEPERMLDRGASSLERALLEEGRAYRAPDHVRKRALMALGLAASTGMVGSALAWLASKSWVTKVALTLSALTAIPIIFALVPRQPPEVPRTAPISVDLPPASPPPLAADPTTAPAPARAIEPPAIRPLTPARAAGPTNSALRAELVALDSIRSSLARDDAAGALSLLSVYFRTFPRGRLHPEAEVLRIDALAKAGRMSAAKQQAREFLKRRPNSVLAARVRRYAEP